MKKLIVHMIGNAHLDPVWLWTWPAGVDEALATCRTACDLLDEYPDLYITRGEAWVYYQVQKLEPKLFARILKHVKSGRWQIVNGWWVQSDCNFPTEESFLKQAEIGKRYFRRNLGVNVTIGYNVDSFGHCAMLPRFLHKSGMDCYIFQRPAAHEKALPANLFTWKAPGSAITTFRLSPTYTSETIEGTEKNLVHSIETANREVGHTMCFYGVGDHGGGPTREQIDWIRNHIKYRPDVELRLSHPKAFFDAVKRSNVKLPEVKGELQYHAVGCYSVVHQVKQEMRKAENILIQAERLAKKHGVYQSETREKLDKAWEKALFNQFHDIMGGSSVATAYEHSRDELGFAKTIAREVIVDITRRLIGKTKPKTHQQIVLANASEHPYKGLMEFEPWLPAHATKLPVTLLDNNGKQIPYQKLAPEAAVSFFVKRLLFPVQIPAMGHKIIQIHYKEPRQPKSTLKAVNQIISPAPLRYGDQKGIPAQRAWGNGIISARLAKSGINGLYLNNNGKSLIGKNGINITAFDDKSDTWSHGISHYDGKSIGMFKSANPWQISEKGPLRIALFNTFNLGSSNILWQVFIQPDEPLVRFRLRVRWGSKQQILKLVIPCSFTPIERWDGCPGGEIRRPIDGQEYPMHNFIALKGVKSSLAVISPDAYGVDVLRNNTIRVTLLRSPYYAHHAPFQMPKTNTYPITDLGMHEYEFSIMALPRFDLKPVHEEINRLTKPIWIGETTRGMMPI